MDKDQLSEPAISLLKKLIAVPSFSGEEVGTALLIENFLRENGIETRRHINNVWATNKYFDPSKPTLLLNSHHDTVKPNSGYQLDPFTPVEKEGKLFGLGSNDAGGSLVCLLAAFIHFYPGKDLGYNIIIAASAEEEVYGKHGIESLLQQKEFAAHLTHKNSCAIVGEPTAMQMAVVEKGLLVLDCIAHGRAGHAARNEGDNAIYKAMMDIEWICCYPFEKISDLLGPVKMTVTSIETENKAHNVIPSECRYVVDIRLNELYTPEEIISVIKEHIQSEVTPRNMRLRSNAMKPDHPLVKAGLSLGMNYFGSPTASDKALMPIPALKLGPGDSARSHTADEFIFLEEISNGINQYVSILEKVCLTQPFSTDASS